MIILRTSPKRKSIGYIAFVLFDKKQEYIIRLSNLKGV